ncbi:MAG: EAL domain-containing protein, partial [Geminicoccaceae bacterium]
LADWAFASAGRQLKVWDKEGLRLTRLSLALPFRHRLALPHMEQAVRDQIQSEGFAPDRIVLDLQENLIATDTRHSNADLMSLKATGIRLALDGFGQGQIAFQNLCHGVLDSLKLAPGLCEGLPGAPPGERLIQALIDFGHGLDLTVSAKGTRDQRQFALLKRLGCDTVQLSAFPPMSAEGATAWLRTIAEKPAVSGAKPLPSPEILVPKITIRQERHQNVDPERS